MSGVIYAINGIALHDAARGWRAKRAGTNTQGGITRNLVKVSAVGQDGYTPANSTFSEQIIVFNVKTTRAGLESLLVLCDAARTLSRTDDPTKEAYIRLASAIPSGEYPLDGWFDVTVTLSLYQGVWRDVEEVVFGAATISSPSQGFQLMTDIGAPISDMDIFIRGVFGEFSLVDSGGTLLKTTKAWPGSSSTGLLYNGRSGQAFLANESSPWTPLADKSDYIDVSGNGGLRFTPKLVSGNPSNRRVELTLTTLTQSSTTLRVRGKRAYRMN